MIPDNEMRLLRRLRHPSYGTGLRLGFGGSAPFNPRNFFAASEKGGWWDPGDLSTMFQDTTGTTPAAVDAVVKRINDKSGNGNDLTQSTTSKAPLLKQDTAGRYYLLFDGTDDGLASPSIDLTGTGTVTIVTGIRRLRADVETIIEHSVNADSNRGFYIIPLDDTTAYKVNARGSAVNQRGYGPYTAPNTVVLSTILKSAAANSGTAVATRINGADVAGSDVNSNTSTGAFANAVLYVGQRASASLAWNGRLYGLILRSATTDAGALSRAETWMNGRTGAY